jgi:hypothetical protein
MVSFSPSLLWYSLLFLFWRSEECSVHFVLQWAFSFYYLLTLVYFLNYADDDNESVANTNHEDDLLKATTGSMKIVEAVSRAASITGI